MPSTLAPSAVVAHRQRAEIPAPRMAKANLQKLETAGYREAVGRCMSRARKALGWSLQELANAIERETRDTRDISQLGRWESGKERLQTDVLMSVPEFGAQFVIALAALPKNVEIVTEIRVRRSA